ncbi:hypothetical protein DIJ64_07150 [Mycobacterium leprae]|uniref:B2126_C3_258 n=1 Tax=Mycobacterium leprae TaxID=1769 RepID=Q49790_MYCLR|nr:hypothetical protein [Mycobacterium leprae]AAA17203.1 B2126_C3_258 [Mycobacterium leprae]AWV47926.1 hypothetical protein DIJ64_07150 [Mycobacterium leprae]
MVAVTTATIYICISCEVAITKTTLRRSALVSAALGEASSIAATGSVRGPAFRSSYGSSTVDFIVGLTRFDGGGEDTGAFAVPVRKIIASHSAP